MWRESQRRKHDREPNNRSLFRKLNLKQGEPKRRGTCPQGAKQSKGIWGTGRQEEMEGDKWDPVGDSVDTNLIDLNRLLFPVI